MYDLIAETTDNIGVAVAVDITNGRAFGKVGFV